MDELISPGRYPDNKEEKATFEILLPKFPGWVCREQRGEEHHNGYAFGRDGNREWITFRTNYKLSVPELEQVLTAYENGKTAMQVKIRIEEREKMKKFLTETGLIGPLREVLGILMGER